MFFLPFAIALAFTSMKSTPVTPPVASNVQDSINEIFDAIEVPESRLDKISRTV